MVSSAFASVLCALLSVTSLWRTGNGSIHISSHDLVEINGTCVALFTCSSGPIHPSLHWYANGNSSENIFASNDGGNAGVGSKYTFHLRGLSDYNTTVKPASNGELIDFNSTLAFSVIDLISQNVTKVSCGSSSSRSSMISSLPAFRGDYTLVEDDQYDEQLREKIFVCVGTYIPLNLTTNSCIGTLQWLINGSTLAQYSFNQDDQFPLSINGNFSKDYHINITSSSRDENVLNLTSVLKLNVDKLEGSVLQCGSNIVKSDSLVINSIIMENRQYGDVCDVSFSSCYETATCHGRLNGNCIISIYSSVNMTSVYTAEGQINSTIGLPDLIFDSIFYYSVDFKESLICQVFGNFTEPKNVARLNTQNIVFISLGVTFLVVSIAANVLCAIIIRVRVYKHVTKELKWKKLLIFGTGSVAVLIIDVILWIVVVCIVAVSQDDLCDSTWQFHRNPLTITSFSLACISLLLSCVWLIMCFKINLQSSSENISHHVCKEDHEMLKDNPQIAKEKIDKHGMIPEIENYLTTSAHRKIGESCQSGRLRVAEERLSEIKEAINKYDLEQGDGSGDRQVNVNSDGNEYHTTKFQTGGNQVSGNITGPTLGYDFLGRPGKKYSTNNCYYHHLSKQKRERPTPSFRDDDPTCAQCSGNDGQHVKSTKSTGGSCNQKRYSQQSKEDK